MAWVTHRLAAACLPKERSIDLASSTCLCTSHTVDAGQSIPNSAACLIDAASDQAGRQGCDDLLLTTPAEHSIPALAAQQQALEVLQGSSISKVLMMYN